MAVEPVPFSLGHAERDEVEGLLDDITNGVYDEFLEAILAAAHGRKRAKRGVRNPRGLGRV